MFRFQLSDGTELTITLDLSKKAIVIQQTARPGAAATADADRITVPLTDVKQIVKSVKELRAYFV